MASTFSNTTFCPTLMASFDKKKIPFSEAKFLASVTAAKSALKIVFDLKPEQLKVLEALALGSDVLCQFPTGIFINVSLPHRLWEVNLLHTCASIL